MKEIIKPPQYEIGIIEDPDFALTITKDGYPCFYRLDSIELAKKELIMMLLDDLKLSDGLKDKIHNLLDESGEL